MPPLADYFIPGSPPFQRCKERVRPTRQVLYHCKDGDRQDGFSDHPGYRMTITEQGGTRSRSLRWVLIRDKRGKDWRQDSVLMIAASSDKGTLTLASSGTLERFRPGCPRSFPCVFPGDTFSRSSLTRGCCRAGLRSQVVQAS